MRNLVISKQITNRQGKSIELYLKDVSLEPMISVEEEVKLAKRVRAGDMLALESLIRANLRFVISVSKQYQNRGLSLEDLISEGNLGLIEAAKRFDESRGFKFISYAVWWIRQSIIKAITEKSRKIRIPANRAMAARKIAEASIKIEQENERKATEDEIGEMFMKSPGDVVDLLKINQKEISIDSPMGDNDDNSSIKDMMEDTNSPLPTKPLLDESLSQEIELALATIDERDAEIIRLSFGLKGTYPASTEDIGIKLGLSSERVRQKREQALKRLRKSNNLELLRSFL